MVSRRAQLSLAWLKESSSWGGFVGADDGVC